MFCGCNQEDLANIEGRLAAPSRWQKISLTVTDNPSHDDSLVAIHWQVFLSNNYFD